MFEMFLILTLFSLALGQECADFENSGEFFLTFINKFLSVLLYFKRSCIYKRAVYDSQHYPLINPLSNQ